EEEEEEEEEEEDGLAINWRNDALATKFVNTISDEARIMNGCVKPYVYVKYIKYKHYIICT
ncbi:MAG: hypothetical protein ACTS68_02025, partial [Candidatus Hodgkinia cicadicola]